MRKEVKFIESPLMKKKIHCKAAFYLAIEKAGGRDMLASILGIRKCTLNALLHLGYMPEKHLLTIKTVLKIPVKVMRPDLFMEKEI